MNETITFHQAQSLIASDTHRFRVVCAGRRFGKTQLCVWEMFAVAIGYADARVAYIAPTYQQARDIAWNELKKVCRPVAKSINESRLEIVVYNQYKGTSTISLRGWESIETMRGQFFNFIVLDEVSSYKNFWETWQEVIRPTLTDKKGGALFISTPKGFNHFYDLYNTKHEDFKNFHFTSYDNPFIPREEIDSAKTQMVEDRFAQEYLADFRKTEGLVYKEFSRDRHVYTEQPHSIREMIGAVDFGFTNPAAVLSIKRDYDNRYWVSSEYYHRGKTDAEVADYVTLQKYAKVYPDPASASGVEEPRRRGVNVRDVTKGADSIRNGISVVRELFKANRLFIHESCVNLISELETYAYPPSRPGLNEYEDPVKEHDHACDALRYGLMTDTVLSDENAFVAKVFNTI